MLRYLQLKDSEEVKSPKTLRKMPDTDKQEKPGSKGSKVSSKVDSPKASPKKVNETKGDTASGGGKASNLDFEGFKSDIQKMFKNLDSKMTDKIDKLDKKFTNLFENFGKELESLKGDLAESKTTIKNVSEKVDEIETSLEFHSNKIIENDEKQKEELEKAKTELDEKITESKQKLLTLEKQDRKYNLIFYGFPEKPNENVVDTLKMLFISDLNIDPVRIERMQFNHGHRMPSEATGAPKPIILRSASYADRDMVLSQSFKLAGTRRRIVTDLPVSMKKERNRLAKEAFKIRKGEKLQTRIREKGLSVFLQVRRDENDSWAKRDVPVEVPAVD